MGKDLSSSHLICQRPFVQTMASHVSIGYSNEVYVFFRLQTPGYEKFRDKIGAAKTVEALEIISLELKSLVLVRYFIHLHFGNCCWNIYRVICLRKN